MVSRVTDAARFEAGDELPASGWRNGKRASAVANCAASRLTSSATIGAGAVLTSGRSPIAIRDASWLSLEDPMYLGSSLRCAEAEDLTFRRKPGGPRPVHRFIGQTGLVVQAADRTSALL